MHTLIPLSFFVLSMTRSYCRPKHGVKSFSNMITSGPHGGSTMRITSATAVSACGVSDSSKPARSSRSRTTIPRTSSYVEHTNIYLPIVEFNGLQRIPLQRFLLRETPSTVLGGVGSSVSTI